MMCAMSKKLEHDLTYDAPTDAVAAMLTDQAYREEVCARQRVLRSAVSVTSRGTTTVVVVDQVQAARGIPSFATKFVGDEITIVQTETWTSAERADVRMEIPGKPATITGTTTLSESGGTTTQHVELEVKVGIPLVGGKIEGLVADLLKRAYAVEESVGRDYLSR